MLEIRTAVSEMEGGWVGSEGEREALQGDRSGGGSRESLQSVKFPCSPDSCIGWNGTLHTVNITYTGQTSGHEIGNFCVSSN